MMLSELLQNVNKLGSLKQSTTLGNNVQIVGKIFHIRLSRMELSFYDLPEYRDAAQESGANFFISKGASSMEEVLALLDPVSFERQRRGELKIP